MLLLLVRASFRGLEVEPRTGLLRVIASAALFRGLPGVAIAACAAAMSFALKFISCPALELGSIRRCAAAIASSLAWARRFAILSSCISSSADLRGVKAAFPARDSGREEVVDDIDIAESGRVDVREGVRATPDG